MKNKHQELEPRWSITYPDGTYKNFVFDPTQETLEQAAQRLDLPANWLLPDTSKPGAMEALGYEPSFHDGTTQWYAKKKKGTK